MLFARIMFSYKVMESLLFRMAEEIETQVVEVEYLSFEELDDVSPRTTIQVSFLYEELLC